MDTIQCAVVLGKLDRFEWEIEQRLRLGERYGRLLSGVPGITRLAVRPDRDCVWAQYTVFVDKRDALQKILLARGVPTAVHYPKPLHLQPAYAAHFGQTMCPQSLRAADTVMSLPMSADLGLTQLETVVHALSVATAGA
jgi:UDP-2-acetamido-2-deoxy-ribo-hexuluronate aminotransferase